MRAWHNCVMLVKQLLSGTALASALPEQHKVYDLCPFSVGFIPLVTCHPGSAALSLEVGTALQWCMPTLLWVWGQLSCLCHYNCLSLLPLSSRKASRGGKSTICVFSQLSSIGHKMLSLLPCTTGVIWNHILHWYILIQLQGDHWWNGAKILIVVNWIEVRTSHNPNWAILRFYKAFLKKTP